MAAYHVLVVDDNHEIRRMVSASIKTLGGDIDVLDVPSAEEALVISASLPLDLIVLDFRLPGMSGLEMVTRLRKRKPGMKIILVTGVADESSRQQVTEAGVNAYFFKPIEIAAFLDTVKQVLCIDQDSAPPISVKPFVITAPGAELSITKPRGASSGPPAKGREAVSSSRFQPTAEERLNALKQQLKATTVLLVNNTGQVVEMTGDPSQITAGSALLPAFTDSILACGKVANTLGREATESLVRFTHGRQQIYLSLVDASDALVVCLSGYFEPDKVGLIERAIQLAVQDLRTILEYKRDLESKVTAQAEVVAAELPAEIAIDQETLSGIDALFSHTPRKGGREKAEGFWETLEENGDLDGKGGRDVISYDEARKMGFAPGDDERS